jgi:RimJ/RimL family protein N-acetyltransferase
MGDVWLAPSKMWKSMVKVAVLWTWDVLDYLQDNWRLRRLQADIAEENVVSRRFIEHYGFVAEGKMKMYDALGRDTIRYARIREEWNAQSC